MLYMNYSLLFHRFWALFIMLSVFSSPNTLSAAPPTSNKLKGSTVLVYTKNGKGYVHNNIPAAVACLKEMAAEEKFTVEVTDDATIFKEEHLKKYQLIVFTSTNNDVFDTDAQRLAFRHYIEAGGGFVGVHSVTGTERNWTWFKMMLGETFSWHARFQAFSLKKIDKTHPSMSGVPDQWTREDECYFGKELFPGMKVLLVYEVNSLNPADSVNIKKNMGTFAQYYPAVWYQQFEGGNIWVTTLGHSKESYQDATYRNHLLQGLRYIASQYKGLDFSKATSISKDDPLK